MNEIWLPLLHHRKIIVITWLIVVSIGVAAVLITPDVYRSEGKLIVRLGRENVTLDATVSLGQGQMSAIPFSRENELNSIVEALRSRTLLEKVVDAVSPEDVLSSEWNIMDYVLPSRRDPREIAISRLTKMFDFSALRKSNLIAVTCEARSRDLAQRANEALVTAFLEQHRSLSRNPGVRNFFQQQADLIADQLKKTEDELLSVKNQAGLGSVVDQKRLLAERIASLETELHDVETNRRAVEAEIAHWQGQQRRLPQRVTLEETVGHPNTAADNMRQSLYSLQLRESEMSTKLTDNHFQLRQIREQLASAQKIYQQEYSDRKQTREGVSRSYEQAELSTLAKQAELEALQERAKTLRPKIEEARRQITVLNDAEVKIARLDREMTLHQANYAKYAQSLEQSRIDEALDQERISNISVVQPPATDSTPVKPDRLLLLTLIAIAAVFIALGVGVAVDSWRFPLRSPETPVPVSV